LRSKLASLKKMSSGHSGRPAGGGHGEGDMIAQLPAASGNNSMCLFHNVDSIHRTVGTSDSGSRLARVLKWFFAAAPQRRRWSMRSEHSWSEREDSLSVLTGRKNTRMNSKSAWKFVTNPDVVAIYDSRGILKNIFGPAIRYIASNS
jgi:hypothetical protein